MDKPDLPAGYRHLHLERTTSTNAQALTRARDGDGGPLWITAQHQTAGRGRQERVWQSLDGNLHVSLLITTTCPPEALPQIGFVAGLALFDAIAGLLSGAARQPRLELKWPNDLLLDDAKLAGILLEQLGSETDRLAVGFGVNIKAHPEGLDYPAADLSAIAPELDGRRVLEALAGQFELRREQWADGGGFKHILADWLARAHGLGRQITVDHWDEQLTGKFIGLNERGALKLALEDGVVIDIYAGDWL
jgi:BirA family biotin operon repressor/biotin-[acetyl-CoA-carboxylase] ligase